MNRLVPVVRVVTIVAVALLAGGCGAQPADPPAGTTPEVTVLPSGVRIPAEIPARTEQDCDPRASYRPTQPPGAIPPGSTMQRIRDHGRLVVGVGPSANLLSFRDPHDGGKVKGFEVDIAKQIAKAIFGDENRIFFRALNTADRIPAIRGTTDDGRPVEKVDMVLAAMTMTCERWRQVAFSTEYYTASQKILVPKSSPATSIDDLGGRKVCASATSTNLRVIAERPARPIPVSAANTSDCLLMLQQGQIDAVSTGDIILAGLAAQDPSMEIRGGRITSEPTGIAMSHEAKDLVRFVNGVLEQLVASGTWKALQDQWLAPELPARIHGEATVPTAIYLPE